MITELKNKYINSYKDRKSVLKEILVNDETQIFGGWESKYIAYNHSLQVFAIYDRTTLENFQNIKVFFNDVAESFIDETLELYEMYAGDKDIEKFIALHFHGRLDLKGDRPNV